MTKSIRDLRQQQAAALRVYHEEYARLEAEIEAIRTARGTKLKGLDYEGYYEIGRDQVPSNR